MDPQSASWKDRLDYASLSDVGLRRRNNQDSLATMVAVSESAWQQRGDLFLVADGMGAHAAGELASKLAADTIPLAYHKLTDRSPPEAALAAVLEANSLIYNRGQMSADFKGMGTTNTTLLLLPQGALLAHVGDSRAYRLRGTRYEQLTFDHSLVWEMRASGQIQGQVPDFIPKNVITRSLGPSPSVQVDLEGPLPILPGDTFLLCSDGLSGPVKDEEMGMILGCLPPTEAVRALVDLANLRGGPDNVSVIVVRAVGSIWTSSAAKELPQSKAEPRSIHPLIWVVLGVLALAGCGLLAIGELLGALAVLVVAGLVGGGALLYRQGNSKGGLRLDGRPLGRGPYTSINCVPNADFVRQLSEIVRDLRVVANREEWAVDWNRFNAFLDRAAAANQAADYSQAIRQYGLGISFIMAELKRQGKKNGPLGK